MRVGTQRRSKSSQNSPNTSRNFTSQEEHVKTYSEKRNLSSPIIDKRTSSPNYIPRVSSPSLSPRAQSPGFARIPSPVYGRESPDYAPSNKKTTQNRYSTPSPSFSKQKPEHDVYVNKMASLQVSRDSPTTMFVDKGQKTVSQSHFTSQRESKSYNSYDSSNIDTSPIVKVSQIDDKAATRRDSWDVLAKTRNILSRQSLESLANMTEEKLDSRIQHEQNTEYISSYRTQNHSQNYSHKYNSDDNYLYRRNDGGGGANSIKVQPIPDGVLGQPVEFESKL